ncbi:MAG TPA: ATP-binding protein [Actinocrinis sp.]
MRTAEHSYQVRLRPVSTAPRTARDVLAAMCVAWDAPGFLEAGRLVLSELVSNAVVHNGAQSAQSGPDAGPAVGLELSLRGGELLMRVHDDGPELPRMAAPPRGAAGGHGLGIVSRLTESWGVDIDPRGGGKTVWCVLREHPDRSGAPSSAHQG